MNNNDPSSTNFVKSHWLFEVEEKELTPVFFLFLFSFFGKIYMKAIWGGVLKGQ